MKYVPFDWNRPVTRSALPRIFRLCLVIGCLVCLAGCPNPAGDPASNALPFQGQTIRLVVPQGWGFKDLWEDQLVEWGARTGAKAELTEASMTDTAGPLLKPGSLPQLIIFPWTRRGELLAGKQVQVLPADLLEANLEWDQLFQGLREKQAEIDIGPALVPISSPVLVCYYRADLLEKAGLQPPETWAEYQLLLDNIGTWAPGLTAVEPWSPEFRTTMFLARAIPLVKPAGHYSVYFNVENGEPQIATPGFVKALEQTRAALKQLAPESLSSDPVACRNLLISGEAALAIGLESGPATAGLTTGATSPPPGKPEPPVERADAIAIGFCRLPGSREIFSTTLNDWAPTENQAPNFVTLTGFSGLCAGIPSGTSAEQAGAALNLLKTLLLDESTPFPPGARSPCWESQAQDAAAWTGKQLSGAEAGKYLAETAKSLRSRQQISELPVLGHAEFRAALTAGLTACLEKNQPPLEALQGVATEWQALLKKLGPTPVLSSYRSALGLSQRAEP